MWFSSFNLIIKQTKYIYFLFLFIGIAGSWLCFFTYPGEEGIRAFLALEDTPFMDLFFEGILDSLDSGDSGLYLYFVMLYFLAYATILFPFVGLWLGGAGVSQEIKSSMSDIFLASPQKKEHLLFRHLIVHGVLFTVLVCFLYLQIFLFFEMMDSSLNYSRIFNGFLLLSISGVFFFSISFFFSVLTIRDDIGRGIAGLVLLGAYFIQAFINFNPALANLKYLNPLYYTNTTPPLLLGDPITGEIIVPVVISLTLLVISVIIFRRRDPIPVQIRPNIQIHSEERNKDISKSKKKDGPVYTLSKRISPLTAEQWAADKFIFLIFFAFGVFSIFSIIGGFPQGEEGYAQLANIYQNNPIAKSIIRDHGDLISSDPLGAIYPQFYGYTWIYFFFLVIIAAGRIVMRDHDAKTLDLIMGGPTTAKTRIFYRMIAILLQMTFLAAFMIISLIAGEFLLGIQSKILEQLLAILVISFVYISLLSFLIAIGIAVPKPRFRKPAIYGVAGITIVCSILPYFSQVLLPFQYFSLLYYLDLIGLIAYSYHFDYLILLFILLGVFIVSTVFIVNRSEKIVYT